MYYTQSQYSTGSPSQSNKARELSTFTAHSQPLYTVNQKKTWQFIFEYNFGKS